MHIAKHKLKANVSFGCIIFKLDTTNNVFQFKMQSSNTNISLLLKNKLNATTI